MNYPHWQEISFYLNEVQKEQSAFTSKPITTESMEETRRSIAALIDQLRGALEQKLDKENAALAVFSIVALVDEEMQGYDYNKIQARWAPLQKDFYGAYTAGEVFFEKTNKILDDPSVPSIVYEIFYFVLKKGFKGKYRDSKTQLYKYMQLLKDKIPVVHPKVDEIELSPPYPKPEKHKKWKYYGWAFSAFALIYVALYIYSNFDR